MSKNNQKLPDTNSSFNSSLFDFPSDKMSLNDSRIKSTRSNHKTENYFYGNISQNDKNSSDKINPIQCGTNRDTLQLESLQPIDNDDNDNPFPLEVSMSNIHNDSFNKNNPFKKKKPDLIIDIDLGEGQNEKLIMKYYEMKHGKELTQTASNKLSQSFNLNVVNGKAITIKQVGLFMLNIMIILI